MPDKSEKERLKEIMNSLRKKADEEFENNFPMDRGIFNNLFDFLDEELGEKRCDHKSTLTKTFLIKNNIKIQMRF